MERTRNVYEVQFESVHGGDRTAYIQAKSEADVEKMLSNKNVAYISKSGTTSYYSSESETREKLGLSSAYDFLS